MTSASNPQPNLADLGRILVNLGCPADKASDLAAHLDRRARQLAAKRGRSYDEALAHLVALMSQGWAAAEKQPPTFPP
jgi:hypothetical protein